MSPWLVSLAGVAIAGCQAAPPRADPAPQAVVGFAAVADQKGGQDQTGPYEVVADWPKPLSQLPGHEKWTWGAVQGIFAESPNRVFILQRGELPKLERPEEVPYPKVGPSLDGRASWASTAAFRRHQSIRP